MGTPRWCVTCGLTVHGTHCSKCGMRGHSLGGPASKELPATEKLKDSAARIAAECDGIRDMLLAKNAAYGDSALNPLRIFSKASAIEQIRVRIDDKLSRIARGDGSGDEDAVKDLTGYLHLLRIAEAMEKEGKE